MTTRIQTLSAAGTCLAFGAVLLLLAGCSTTYQTRGGATASPFLGDTSQLRPGGSGASKLVYINPKTDFRRYRQILLEPVRIMASGAKSSAFTSMSKEQQQAMVNYVDASVRDKLKGDYTFVTQPGADVMTLRICITEAVGATMVLNVLSAVTPMGIAVNVLKTAVTGTGTSVGKAGAEMELKDSLTGERLAAVVDERAGRKYAFFADKFRSYGAFDDAFDYWSARLQQRLAEARAAKAAPAGK